LAPSTTIVPPECTRAERCSSCQAVIPLTTTLSASAVVHTVRHGHQVGGVEQLVARPAADLGDRGEPPTDQGGIHLGAGRGHRADDVVAGHEGERRLVVVLAEAHLLLGERDAGRVHPQDHLAPRRGGEIPGAHLQAARLDLARQHDLGGAGRDGGVVHVRLRSPS